MFNFGDLRQIMMQLSLERHLFPLQSTDDSEAE